ncbi:MAG: helix-turn-helix transcriptional regulator [Elusimicrobia bacterium]|nr:helix-turn-helix transcriptional regulator [Elusimicrobiota bacterium]
MDKLKNRLRVLRAERDISQEVLAKAVGVSRQTIVAIEGEDYSPSIVLALKVARYFGKRMEEVFWLETRTS